MGKTEETVFRPISREKLRKMVFWEWDNFPLECTFHGRVDCDVFVSISGEGGDPSGGGGVRRRPTVAHDSGGHVFVGRGERRRPRSRWASYVEDYYFTMKVTFTMKIKRLVERHISKSSTGLSVRCGLLQGFVYGILRAAQILAHFEEFEACKIMTTYCLWNLLTDILTRH